MPSWLATWATKALSNVCSVLGSVAAMLDVDEEGILGVAGAGGGGRAAAFGATGPSRSIVSLGLPLGPFAFACPWGLWLLLDRGEDGRLARGECSCHPCQSGHSQSWLPPACFPQGRRWRRVAGPSRPALRTKLGCALSHLMTVPTLPRHGCCTYIHHLLGKCRARVVLP